MGREYIGKKREETPLSPRIFRRLAKLMIVCHCCWSSSSSGDDDAKSDGFQSKIFIVDVRSLRETNGDFKLNWTGKVPCHWPEGVEKAVQWDAGWSRSSNATHTHLVLIQISTTPAPSDDAFSPSSARSFSLPPPPLFKLNHLSDVDKKNRCCCC